MRAAGAPALPHHHRRLTGRPPQPSPVHPRTRHRRSPNRELSAAGSAFRLAAIAPSGPPRSLIESIQQVADCPCPEHQDGFLRALPGSAELLFKVVDTNIDGLDGPHRVGPDDQIRLEQVEAQGRRLLLAYPDLDAARRAAPAATIIGIERDQALRMVLADAGLDGLLVAAATDNDAWAAATKDNLAALLSA